MAITNVEKILYSYFENLAKQERIQKELKKLMSVHGMQMEKNVGDVIVDPVARRMDEVERLEAELKKIERWTVPVTRLVRDLPEELLYLLNGHYFRRQQWKALRRKKGWSEAKCWRKKKELLRVAEEYLDAS